MKYSARTLTAVTGILVVGVLTFGVWWRLQDPDEGEAGGATAAADAPGVELGAAGREFATDIPEPVRGAVGVRDTL